MIRSRNTAVIAALLSTVSLSLAWAAQPGAGARHAEKMAATGMPATPEGCAAMKKMCDDMASKQKEADARLERLVVTMNEASSSTKVDAMAAVISELVTQRTESRAHMMRMGADMNEHMMQHVMDSAPAEMRANMKKGIDGCSMMKGAASESR
ncbi:MAG: hypothetical protein SGJ09_15780 [Phycisphaerae bacterium]|nr:hypothetical protein [Phycisphaerae bacterium]MDZ4831644.1 hypothetical protein [Phycisphaerae bacterium]